jgi:hypothetical protein
MSGEHPNGRKAIDTMTKDLIKGGFTPAKAQKKAKEAALRHDRKNR